MYHHLTIHLLKDIQVDSSFCLLDKAAKNIHVKFYMSLSSFLEDVKAATAVLHSIYML